LSKSTGVISGVDLSGLNLSGLDLIAVNFNGTNLKGTNLSSADLREASFIETILWATNLTNAALRGATMSGVDMVRVKLEGAKMDSTERLKAIYPAVLQMNFPTLQFTLLIHIPECCGKTNQSFRYRCDARLLARHFCLIIVSAITWDTQIEHILEFLGIYIAFVLIGNRIRTAFVNIV
jgi:hypothetical protein